MSHQDWSIDKLWIKKTNQTITTKKTNKQQQQQQQKLDDRNFTHITVSKQSFLNLQNYRDI